MNTSPKFEFNLEQVAAALLVSSGQTEGLWRLSAKLRFAGLTTNLAEDGKPKSGDMPTGLVAVEGLALFPVEAPGPLVFDAAKLLAATRPARRSRPGAKAAGSKRKPSTNMDSAGG